MTRFILSLLATLVISVLLFPKRLIPLLDDMPFTEILSLLTTAEVLGFVLLFAVVYLTGPGAMKLIDILEKKFRGN